MTRLRSHRLPSIHLWVLLVLVFSPSLWAARYLPLDVSVGGVKILNAGGNDDGRSSEDQVWGQAISDAEFNERSCLNDFVLEPDETKGNRITLHGDIVVKAKYGGSEARLKHLQLTRVAPGENKWQFAKLEQKRINRARMVGQGKSLRPNVVVILCDDIRWNALGCAGHPHLRTPNIDQLADEGIFFENMFCTTSLCSPSRASILSGLYAHTHGVTNNFTDYPADLASFPRQLQSSGYESAYIGKWHMGEKSDEPRPGFDYFVTHRGQGLYYDAEFRFNGKERRVMPGYYTHNVTDMAVDWIEKDHDKPFLLMIGQKAPHSFYLPEPKYAHTFDDVEVNYPQTSFQLDDKPAWMKKRLTTWHGIYGPLFNWRKEFPNKDAAAVRDFGDMIRAYWGTILSVDDSVGQITQALRDVGELDNTVIVFLGDNGLHEGENGMVDKRTMHEASIRVPMIVRYPGLTPADRPKRISKQVLTHDLAPTILDLCGADPLPKVHGRSFKKMVMSGDPEWRDAWFYHYNYEKQFPYTPNIRGIRTDRWKYIRYPHGDGSKDRHMSELYDMVSDPGERKNLISDPSMKDLIADLSRQLDELIKRDLGDDAMPMDEGIKSGLPDKDIR